MTPTPPYPPYGNSRRPPYPPHPPRQVCPGEWVYHYVDTAKIGAGHYGPGHHLRFTLSKDANEGAAIAMTRHSNVVNVPSCRCHMRHALGMCR